MTTDDPSDPPIARTTCGRLRGRRDGALCVFQGVPFASPPVGPRRFLTPEPPEPWTGVRDARAHAAAPPQVTDPLAEMLGLGFDTPLGEDCLYLNLWTPALDDGRRPVMLWLHGGAFASGSSASALYDGARLCERGDVVVVTLNYRVGALGFSYLAPFLPDSSGHERAGANVGLQDQIACLRWLRDEVAAFGGDPTRVTVFGESAGAGSGVALLAMPEASGLFQRAILQSPAPEGMLSADEGTERARQLLQRLDLVPQASGVSETQEIDPAALQALPLERILEAQQACIAAGPHRTGMFFAPVIDGRSLPEAPLDAIAAGHAADVEVLIGTTRQEMQLYSTVPGLGEFDDPVLEQIVASRVPGDEVNRLRVARNAIRVYREELSARGGPPSKQELFFALETDLSLRVPSIRLAESQSHHQPSTYMYLFTWESPLANGHGGSLGACHALDLPFTFGALDSEKAGALIGSGPPAGAAARALSNRIMDAWLAFAHSGNPSHGELGEWPRYSGLHRTTMLLGEKCGPFDAPMERERAVWDDYQQEHEQEQDTQPGARRP
jgi:para-nitrobenzyl esterase